MNHFYLNAFLLLFVAIDPIGLAPMFAALSSGSSRSQQRNMAIKGVTLAAFILLVFTLAGDSLLHALGIGLPAFRIAGGILLFLLAIDMVFARQSGLRSATVREQREAEHKDDISVFPLAFPLIAGPGALTTVLLLTAGHRGEPLVLLAVLGILASILLVTLLSLVSAARILALLGETGANVVSRLLGLLLAALAVQFVLDGVTVVLGGHPG
ncbi:MAG TPA: MarC family protein [Gammaproteobacteria bacterium]|nr:MarC family protein [Gammaproteobacteria bacterium]